MMTWAFAIVITREYGLVRAGPLPANVLAAARSSQEGRAGRMLNLGDGAR